MLSRDQIVHLMDELVTFQKRKVLELARQQVPGITEEDARNPQDFPALINNARFNYEDGILAGYLSARIALLAELKKET